MVGQALTRALSSRGTEPPITAPRGRLDLRRQDEVEAFLDRHRPGTVLVAAATVGGIEANRSHPARFAYDNLMIAANLIHGSWRSGVRRLLFLGSSCIYPKFAPQPIGEDALLSGSLEPTNEAYAIAKIAGLKLCEYYRREYGCLFHAAMPCNLYGPGDNYHPEHSHVIPGLLRRFHEAKVAGKPEVVLWGSGTPLREFLHVDDLASACLRLCEVPDPPDLANVGSGEEVSIAELARLVAAAVDYRGRLVPDPSRPDGTPRKVMDSGRIRALGWSPSIRLEEGLKDAYRDFLARSESGALRSA